MSYFVAISNNGAYIEEWWCRNLKTAILVALWRTIYVRDVAEIYKYDWKEKQEYCIATVYGLANWGDEGTVLFDDGSERTFKIHHKYYEKDDKYDVGVEFKDGILWLSEAIKRRWLRLKFSWRDAEEALKRIKVE